MPESNAARRSLSSKLVGRPYTGIVIRKIPGVAGDEQHGMHLRGRPDHSIRQFDPMASTMTNSAFRNLLIDCDDIEAAQEAARRRFKIMIGAHHDLHPGDDADCFLR